MTDELHIVSVHESRPGFFVLRMKKSTNPERQNGSRDGADSFLAMRLTNAAKFRAGGTVVVDVKAMQEPEPTNDHEERLARWYRECRRQPRVDVL